jgi:hypothetical protein
MTPVKTRVVLSLAFEQLDRLILTAAKATLLFAAVVVFLPLIFRASLTHLNGRRRRDKSQSG